MLPERKRRGQGKTAHIEVPMNGKPKKHGFLRQIAVSQLLKYKTWAEKVKDQMKPKASFRLQTRRRKR